jgi:hypothetical protein
MASSESVTLLDTKAQEMQISVLRAPPLEASRMYQLEMYEASMKGNTIVVVCLYMAIIIRLSDVKIKDGHRQWKDSCVTCPSLEAIDNSVVFV